MAQSRDQGSKCPSLERPKDPAVTPVLCVSSQGKRKFISLVDSMSVHVTPHSFCVLLFSNNTGLPASVARNK